MYKESHSNFIEKGLSFFVPFLGLIWFFKKKNKGWNLIGFFVNLAVCIGIVALFIKIFPTLHMRLSFFGKRPLCNLKAERGIHFGSFVFILCYRCTFLILGGVISFFIMYFKKVKIHYFYIIFSILFSLPCFFDGILQLTTTYESTNYIRATTGFLAGFGIGYILYLPFRKWNLFL